MSKVCKKCGKSSPDGSAVCKYCLNPFKTVKTAAKSSDKTKDAKSKATKTTGGAAKKTAAKPTGEAGESKSKAVVKPKSAAKTTAKPAAKPAAKATKPATKTTKPAPKPAAKTTKPASASKTEQTKGKTSTSTKTKSAAAKIGADYVDVFNDNNYIASWKRFAKGGNAGIILTDTSGLSKPSGFLSEIQKYCSARKHQARYTILDLNTVPKGTRTFSDCASIVALLDEIYSAAVPTYLLIVGDSSVIPFMNWVNYSGDDDRTVPSDLPYITLDTRSPWDGQEYSFVCVTQVGRIPSSYVNGFENAIKYFQFAAQYESQSSVSPFAITAYEWKQASKLVFSKLKCDILSSPEYTCNERYAASYGMRKLPNLDDRNLLGFNLHGADTTHYWYGQRDDSFPEAFEAACLPKSKKGYTVCVEACYGARPKVEVGGQQSIVVSALSNKCVAFVGSTRIAYGAVDKSMCCADVIANEFINSALNSNTAGSAFLSSLTALLKTGYDESIIKTLAEFALYGDPSIVPFGGKKAMTSASTISKTQKAKTKTNAAKAIKLIPCDLATINSKDVMFSNYAGEIQKAESAIKTVTMTSKTYVTEKFAAVSKKAPKIYKVADSDEYRTIYKTTVGKVKTYLKLHINGKGKVIKTYISK